MFCWEFDLGSQKWNERHSYQIQAWRAVGGSYAFGKWLTGDTAAGRLIFIDDKNFSETGSPLQFQIESAPVGGFLIAQRLRVLTSISLLGLEMR
jgi:hypothetical protein